MYVWSEKKKRSSVERKEEKSSIAQKKEIKQNKKEALRLLYKYGPKGPISTPSFPVVIGSFPSLVYVLRVYYI